MTDDDVDRAQTKADEARRRVDDDLAQLERSFTIDGLLHEASVYYRRNAAEIREQVRIMARNLGRTARDNPIPAFMVLTGLAWLALASRRSPAQLPARREDYAPAPPPGRPVDESATPPPTAGTNVPPGPIVHEPASG